MTANSRSLLYLTPPHARDLLSRTLSDSGWAVHVATDPHAAIALMREYEFSVGLVHWDFLECDSQLSSHDTEVMLDADRSIKWVALLSDTTELSQLITTYFYDFHTLPIDTKRLLVTLGHAHGMAQATRSHTTWQDNRPFQSIISGDSPIMLDFFEKIRKIAATDLTVMIRGESGTGKELAAHAIHQESARSREPFVVVNCGALPRELVQAELFGHEKGAFTGAASRRLGRVESADGGTLFLDEVGDLPLDLQANMLRFLQEKTIDRLGGTGQVSVDVRVLAATHVNLERAVKEGRFREDLYYRLSVLALDVPPLRSRGSEVEFLARHFCKVFAREINPHITGFSKQAINAINMYSWPGNVREMINRIQRAILMCKGRSIKPEDLGLDKNDRLNFAVRTLSEARERAEKEAINHALGVAHNNVSKAARLLDVSRVTLYRLMEVHDIKSKNEKK